ncbi:MAG: cellulose synthase subunit BcsC-related outer membrane protein, partial [Rhizobacter sp.]|nr:cellulose synthase subunit BcsC-related outer membrane protein [Rhizobacter sp.]
MHRTQRRLWFRLKFQQAQAAALGGQRRQAQALLQDAQAAATGDAGLTLDVAEAWIDAGDPAQARRVMGTLSWPPATAVVARLRQAALMLRIDDHDALPPLLSDIAATPGRSAAQQRELVELRDALALRQARRLRDSGAVQAAIDVLGERLGDPPARVPVLLAHAETLRAAGRSKEAIAQYQRALALEPGNDDAHEALVASLLADGEHGEARQLISGHAARGGDPGAAADTQVALAGALVELGQLADARKALEAVLAADPGHARAARLLAQIERREGRADLAVARLQRAAAADARARAASGAQRPISRLVLLAPAPGSGKPAGLQLTRADPRDLQAESSAWQPYRPLAGWLEQQSPSWAGALDWRWRSGSEGLSSYSLQELPVEYARPLGGDARLVLRNDLVQIDAGSVSLADQRSARDFGSLLLCQPGCATGTAPQHDSGLALNVAYQRDAMQVDLGNTPLGFAVVRPVGGWRVKGDLGAGSYSLDVSSRPVTSSLLSYAGTRDPRTGQTWGGVQATGARLGLSRDDGLAFGAWSSFGLHQLHGRNVQTNLRQRAMGGFYWRVVNEDQRVISVGVNAMAQGFKHNAGEFTFGHGGYYSPQSYRSLSLPLSYAQLSGRWSFSARAALSHSRSRTDSAPFYPTDAAMQAAAQALAAGNGVDPHYRGGSSSGSGYSLAATLEAQLSPRLFIGGRIEIERSDDYAPNRALIYLRFTPGETSLRPLAFPPEPVIPTSEY